jgi:hypothetical protein
MTENNRLYKDDYVKDRAMRIEITIKLLNRRLRDFSAFMASIDQKVQRIKKILAIVDKRKIKPKERPKFARVEKARATATNALTGTRKAALGRFKPAYAEREGICAPKKTRIEQVAITASPPAGNRRPASRRGQKRKRKWITGDKKYSGGIGELKGYTS